MTARVFIVDDERLTRETLVERLKDEGYDARAFASPFDVLEALAETEADVVITDLRMPSMDGAELHRRIQERWPDVAVVFMTAFGTVESAVQAMRDGAADYLTKPLNTEELLIRLRRIVQHRRDREEIRQLRLESARHHTFGELTYHAPSMARAVERALAVADSDVTVLVQGPTGTGKEVLCRAIHGASRRSNGPFVAVNCAGLNPNLVESELFGHEAGAFTGATRLRKGRIEVAHGGTMLIDEVDDLSPEIQVRLLRFLQDHTFERVGSSQTREADVRVLCATKHDLGELVAAGRFREDLYYRINTVVVTIPPLRERREDIPHLAELFLRRACDARGDAEPPALSPEALRLLLAHEWPGNVRELLHAMEHAHAFSRCGTVLPQHLPPALQESELDSVLDLRLPPDGSVSLPDVLGLCERRLIDWALARTGGNQARAAELLSIPRTTLRSRLEALKHDAADASD